MFKNLLNKLTFYILLFLLVVLMISLVRNYQKIRSVQDQISLKEAQVAKVENQGKELQEKLNQVQSTQYIERQLRDKLGLAKEGEIVVILPPPEVLRQLVPKFEEKQAVPPEPNWKKWVKLFI